jgi:serine/threonine-protein kinase
VIKTDPKASAKLREDSTIHVFVSKGRPPRAVPEVVGDLLATADAKLRGAGFVPAGALEFSETVEKDHVIRREPADEEVTGGATITLVVSAGPEPRKISNWQGKTFEEAKAALEELGLKAKKADGFSDTVAVGQVITTDPGPGQTAPRGSTVTVFVSVGPETVTVPSVVGMNASQGMKVLRDAGLTIGQISGPRKKQQILFQDPSGNSKAARGTPVNLYVN